MLVRNICALLSSIIECLMHKHTHTQTEAEQEVAYKRKEQELFMTTPPGLSARVLTVMGPEM